MAASTPRGSTPETTPRHVWLAALGAAAIVRREAVTAAQVAREQVPRLGEGALRIASDAHDVARGIALTLQERFAPTVAAAVDALRAGFAPRRPAARRAPASRARARAGGRGQAGRTQVGRTQAAQRIARKGR